MILDKLSLIGLFLCDFNLDIKVKKFFVILLSSLILISTSGIPLVFHLCEKSGITLADKCEVCEEEVIKISCCESENPFPFNQVINDYDSICCQSKIIEKKVDDRFVLNKSEWELFTKNFQRIILPEIILNKIFSSVELSFYPHSPPKKLKQSDLNILYSNLLI